MFIRFLCPHSPPSTEQERSPPEEGCPPVTGPRGAGGHARVCAGLGLASAAGLWEASSESRLAPGSGWCPPLHVLPRDSEFRLDWRTPGPSCFPTAPPRTPSPPTRPELVWTGPLVTPLRAETSPLLYLLQDAARLGWGAVWERLRYVSRLGSRFWVGLSFWVREGGSGHVAMRLGGSLLVKAS